MDLIWRERKWIKKQNCIYTVYKYIAGQQNSCQNTISTF